MFIRTFGCQMNVHDSETLLASLAPAYLPAGSEAEADLVLVNTCSVRDKAEQKVYSYLGRLGALKRARPGMLVGVGGCVAQQEGRRLLEKSLVVDFVFGPHTLDSVPALVERRLRGGRREVRLEDDGPGHFPSCPAEKPGPTAFVTIMKGCDNWCSYCVVPLTRGREASRPARAVVEEARALLSRGAVELTLLGQNVNSYRDPGTGGGLVELLEELDSLPGLARVRFLTSHPRDLDARLIAAMARLPSVCGHLHLPVQAGSDRILAAMNRGYTAREYLGKLAALRVAMPGFEVTSDVIVGFPGETRAEFEQTLRLVEEARFQNSFSFRYSPRPGTAASKLPQLPDPASRHGYLPELQALQDSITSEKHQALVGRTLEVLVEGRGNAPARVKERPLEGRTRDNYIVHFPGADDLLGTTARVRVTASLRIHLEGELVG